MNALEENPYLALTREFNDGEIRAIICSGQAVVLHGLAVMSKDGDWILRETAETLDHVIRVLERHGATYRFGAPLGLPWLRMGWSSHFEFHGFGMRVRTDFFTRPPRIPLDRLLDLWREIPRAQGYPVIGLPDLIRMKLTNRERDFAVIGELSRNLANVEDVILWSRSARDLIELGKEHREALEGMISERPLLIHALNGDRERLGAALDKERRDYMELNERRISAMQELMIEWRRAWPSIVQKTEGLPLREAHNIVTEVASKLLPSS